jgi:hypothetical protein
MQWRYSMNPQDIKKAEKLKKLLERVAFASLIVDISIAIVTLISINFAKLNLLQFQLILNYVLTFIVIIAVGLFAILLAISHYQKLLDNFEIINNKVVNSFHRPFGRSPPPKKGPDAEQGEVQH